MGTADLSTVLSIIAAGIAVYGVLHQVTQDHAKDAQSVLELHLSLNAAQQDRNLKEELLERCQEDNRALRDELIALRRGGGSSGGASFKDADIHVSGDLVAGDESKK